MSGVVLFSAVAIGLLGWSVFWAIRTEKRLSRWFVSSARKNSWRGAAVAFCVHTSALAGFLLLWLLGYLISSSAGEARWAALTVVPAALVYGPLMTFAFPASFSGFAAVRRSLQRAGASGRVARAIAWGGGPVAFIGLLCIVEALRRTFLS